MNSFTIVARSEAPAYTAGPPLDGGLGPSVLAGNGSHGMSPAQIGALVGVLGGVIVLLIGGFVWRAYKIKKAKARQAAAVVGDGQSSEGIAKPSADRDADRDAERASTIDNDKASAAEQPARAHPIWKTWGRHGQRDGAEEYEITNRI